MATELGKAYVQVIPSAQGISGKLTNLLKGESQAAGTSSGSLIGSTLVSKLKAVVAAAGIGKAIAASITEGAKLQQSLGGVETLFKENADLVINNARQAYKTAGVSSNEYMEGVTSFAASLLQSTAGNTKEAAQISDMAYRDMSDNANKFGTNMRDIQNAYQGFAKQNYTMLDNLKLGYGGTKSEMQRLLADAQKLTGVKYDINNLSDVYQAIHAIQDNLKITGTTALEASTTLSGSAQTMKAAFTDVLGNLAIGENIRQSFTNLAESISTFVFDNLIPMIGNIFKSLPEGLMAFTQTMGPLLMTKGGDLINNFAQGFQTGLPQLISKAGDLVVKLIDGFTKNAPQMIKAGVEFLKNLTKGVVDSIPTLIEKAGEIALKLVDAFVKVAPQLLSAGVELITNLATGFFQKLPEILTKIGEFLVNLIQKIVEKAPEFLAKGKELINKLKEGMSSVKDAAKQAVVTIITNILEFIKSKVGEFLNKGKELVSKLKDGFVQKKNDVVNAAKQIIENAKKAVEDFKNRFVSVGKNIIEGIAQGIRDGARAVVNAAKDAAQRALNAAKSFLGIKSPSRVFAKEVGKFIPEGMAMGISKNLSPVKSALKEMTSLDNIETNKDLSYKVKTDSFISPQTFVKDEVKKENGLVSLNLSIGGQNFKAFVDRISLEQNKEVQLKLSY